METHIRQEETEKLLHSITPTGFKFCHKPRIHGCGGGVGFFINKAIQFRSVGQNICGDFNIHADTSSNDSTKFQNCLESCNITQNVHTYLYGHILDLVLTPTDASVISNVRIAEFICDHALVLAQVDPVNPPSHKAKVVTFRRYHKFDLASFRKDLGNCAFIRHPGDTVSVLCDST